MVIFIHGTVYNQGAWYIISYKIHAALLMDMTAEDHSGLCGFDKVQQVLAACSEPIAYLVTNASGRRLDHKDGLFIYVRSKLF